jgi:hypothetical protein
VLSPLPVASELRKYDHGGMETPAGPRPWAGIRDLAGLACIIMLLVLASTLLYYVGGFIYFRFTGNLPSGFVADEMEWSDLGSFLLGCLVLGGALMAGAWFLLPEDGEQLESSVTENGSEVGANVPDGVSLPSPAPQGQSPRETKDAADQIDRLQRALDDRRDQQMLGVVRSDPQLAAIEYLLQRLLREQEVRDRRQAVEAERRGRRHELVLMGTGTLLGVVAPVLTAPLLGKL